MKKLVCFLIMAALLLADAACAAEGLRLHVIGRTDLYEDQQFKLQARDTALEYISKNGTDDMHALEDELNRFASHMHADVQIHVQRGVFPYPESITDGRIYPAGEYDAIKIYIGNGEGRNWWGMLYPEYYCTDEDVIYYSAIVDWFMRLFAAG